jgi:hypothetical protein
MSIRGVAIAVTLGLAVLAARPLEAAILTCPAQLPSPHAGFELVGTAPSDPRPLDALRLYDGPPGEESRASPAELAPADTTEHQGTLTATWTFAGNEALLMVCVYRDSPSYYRGEPRPMPDRCSMERSLSRTVAGCG